MNKKIDIQELQKNKELVRKELEARMKDDNEIGMLDYSKELLLGMGLPCENRSVEEIKKLFKSLPGEQQKQFIEQLNIYKQAQDEALEEFKEGKSHCFKKIAKISAKGAAIGATIAGIVNATAPGLVPTFCGYLAGKGYGDIITELGLVAFGILASPEVNATAILKIAGLTGGAVGGAIGVGKEVFSAVKGRKQRNETLNKRKKVEFDLSK